MVHHKEILTSCEAACHFVPKGLKYKPVHLFQMPIKEGCCFFVFCQNLYTLFSVILWAIIAKSMTSKFLRYFLTLSMTSAEKMSLKVHFSHQNLPPSFSFPSCFSDTSDVNFAPITCCKVCNGNNVFLLLSADTSHLWLC